MRFVLMGISLSLTVMLFFLGGTSWAKKKVWDKHIQTIEQEIARLNQETASLSRYETSDPEDIEKVYFDLCNAVKMIASFNNVEARVTIPAIKDGMNIRSFVQDSEIQGVDMIPIKISFHNLKSSNAYFFILGAWADLERRAPLKTTQVYSSAGDLDIFINLYGI